MSDLTDTIAAIATAPGAGGIGVIRVSGPGSLSIAQHITGVTPQPRHARYCSFMDSEGVVLDRGLVLYFMAPASYTGEDVVEFHGHGGQVVLNLLLRQTLALGARMARPGEFTERAFLNGKLDLLQAEAVADLINSKSEYAARSARRSLDGDFSRAVSDIRERIIAIQVFVEGALDFPEEEIDFIARSDIEERAGACITLLEELLENARGGRVLNEGLRVVIIGRPNVGKSSILNRLTGSDRAIVTELPGTTRDVIEDSIVVQGVFVNVVDTAGIHVTENPVEREGIRRSRAEIERSDVVLLVMESGRDLPAELEELRALIPASRQVILVENKIDVHAQPPSRGTDNGCPRIALSAKTGDGMDLLQAALRHCAGLTDVMDTPLLARTRHIRALEQARARLQQGLHNYREDHAAELFAEELRRAQHCLGEITGEFTAEALLGEIFAKFCIGK